MTGLEDGSLQVAVSTEINAAVRLHRQGNLEKARRMYERILERQPAHPDALHLLGVIAYQAGQFSRAANLISKAIRLDTCQPLFYVNLGNAYRENRALDQSVTCYRKALEINPEYPPAHYHLGNALAEQKKFDSAVRSYQTAIELEPNLIEAYHSLGNIYRQQGRARQAVDCYQKTLQAQADFTPALIGLGGVYQQLGRHAAAVRCLADALRAEPDACFRVYNNLGVSLQALGNLDEAIRCFKTAVELQHDYAAAYYNLGIAYHAHGAWAKAIHVLEKTVELKADHGGAYNLLVHLLQKTCDWRKLKKFAPALDGLTRKALENHTMCDEAVFGNVSRHQDPALNFALAQTRSRAIVEHVAAVKVDFCFDRFKFASDRITLGYYSEDFRNHPIGHLTQGLYRRHSREMFKVYCYSYGKNDRSACRAQIVRDCDRFVDVRKMNTRETARRIHEDGVCILIDLGGHTAGSRLDVCALRPAPVQVAYLGFPGTTGADFFDYIITDKIVSPEDHAACYSEKFVYMPHCYQINRDGSKISVDKPQRQDVGLPAEGFVFSSFNQAFKLEPVMFHCWMNILRKVPRSVIWLLWDNDIAADNLRQAARERGVDPARQIFAEKWPRQDHQARLGLTDLALDTRIYNGHTTTSDALWAGVPVIALLGSHFASRVSASLLSAIGLTELVTTSLAEYEKIAVELARCPDRLNAVREKLLRNRPTAPLFDTSRFVRNLEAAYKEMWATFQNGGRPHPITVIDPGTC
ncbi:MAG: tetratricopeptide repeat protein [Desulfobacterales bacterium]|nr:MAG: tetratricopeptide repeat protein [Desulfobacterales bacterium]